MFLDWPAFELWFLSKFTYPDKAQCTALILEGTSYHQQGCTLDMDIDGFKQLACCSGFPRSTQVVLHFWHKLDPLIYKQIDGIVDGCPRDGDIEGLIATVCLVD